MNKNWIPNIGPRYLWPNAAHNTLVILSIQMHCIGMFCLQKASNYELLTLAMTASLFCVCFHIFSFDCRYTSSTNPTNRKEASLGNRIGLKHNQMANHQPTDWLRRTSKKVGDSSDLSIPTRILFQERITRNDMSTIGLNPKKFDKNQGKIGTAILQLTQVMSSPWCVSKFGAPRSIQWHSKPVLGSLPWLRTCTAAQLFLKLTIFVKFCSSWRSRHPKNNINININNNNNNTVLGR